ncbi:MAG: hypothetical protein VB115_09530 [Christensenellaceae bacterium]|nr:hypothetical protein [Christensenellaceae bacterium]
MKMIERNPEKFDVLDLFSAIGQNRDLKLKDEESIRAFLESINLSLHQNSTPTMLYGRHAESMFGYVVASLGECFVVKKEDDGNVFLDIGEAKIPDYRLVMKNKQVMMVEVKNCHQRNYRDIFRLRISYINQLKRYCDANDAALKIAIYWTKMDIWTLLDPSDFVRVGPNIQITLFDAIKNNEMCTLGDVAIGAIPPLRLIIYPDKSLDRSVGKDGEVAIRISDVKVFCNEDEIVDEFERRIAVMLIMFGNWEEVNEAKMRDNQLEYFELIYKPEVAIDDQDEYDQNFDIIGFMSSIISRQYKMLTAPHGLIEKIAPPNSVGMLGFIVPEDYHGKQLPLWRLHIQPGKTRTD